MKAKELKNNVEKITNFENCSKFLPVFITIKEGKLRYDAGDEKVIVSTNLDTNISATVEMYELYKVLKALKNREIELQNTDTHLQILSGKTVLSIELKEAVDKIEPIIELQEIGTLESAKELKRAVQFAGNDELRPQMSNVYICSVNNEIVATDAHKLYYSTLKTPFLSSVFLSKKLIKSLEADKEVIFSENDEWLKVEQDNVIFYTRKESYKYPNYKAVIPIKERDNLTIQIETKQILDFIELAKIQGSKSTNQIKFSITYNSVTLEAKDIDFNSAVSTEIGNSVISNFPYPDTFQIGFNHIFLSQILKLDKKEVTTFYLFSSKSAVLLNDNFLLMPVRLDV